MTPRATLAALLVFAGALSAAPAQTPASGLDLTTFDRSVRPQDDLFRFVNGGWLARAAVPAERISYGVFQELAERTENDLRVIVEAVAAAGPYRSGSALQQIADLHTSMADVARVDAAGATPLRPQLDKIDAIRSARDLAAQAGAVSAIGFGGPFAATLAADAAGSTRLVVLIEQGGTLLPDRDYYLRAEPAYARVRQQYETYLTTIFELVGRPAPGAEARAVLALETELARAQWAQAESREGARVPRPFTLAQLTRAMPGFDWAAWARPQGIDLAETISLSQPSFFERFAALVPTTPLETWRAWLAARYITAAAPYISRPFELARFELFGRTLTGQEEPRARWKRAVGIVNVFLGDALGRLYVEKHFPPAAKAKVQTLVENLVTAFRRTIRESAWMSRQARGAAMDKLDQLTTKIGYPDQWSSYGGLVIKPDDLLGNAQRTQRHQNDSRISRVRDATDRRRWLLTPQTVNAYYSPALNEIVLPAAILQPPLFNASADVATSYGAIGGVIGHELVHAVDTQGRMYDASGAARNWWRSEDDQAFTSRLRQLAGQFDGYRPLPDVAINGALTASENLADLAGLSMALEAYRLSLGGKPAPVLDGFTGDQRVFLGWAQAWRAILREGFLRQSLLSTPHAPPEYRANGPLVNIDAFHDAFGVKPGDRLYRAPTERVRIW
jgi:putative endopeptidase